MQHEDFGLKQIQGLDIDLSWFKLKPEQWIRILEQVVELKFILLLRSQHKISPITFLYLIYFLLMRLIILDCVGCFGFGSLVTTKRKTYPRPILTIDVSVFGHGSGYCRDPRIFP